MRCWVPQKSGRVLVKRAELHELLDAADERDALAERMAGVEAAVNRGRK